MNAKHANYHLILERERLAALRVFASFMFYEQADTSQIRQIRQMQTRLRRIRDALKRLEDGVFGVCQICGDEIQKERLAMLPYVELCIGCQRRQERDSDLDRR